MALRFLRPDFSMLDRFSWVVALLFGFGVVLLYARFSLWLLQRRHRLGEAGFLRPATAPPPPGQWTAALLLQWGVLGALLLLAGRFLGIPWERGVAIHGLASAAWFLFWIPFVRFLGMAIWAGILQTLLTTAAPGNSAEVWLVVGVMLAALLASGAWLGRRFRGGTPGGMPGG